MTNKPKAIVLLLFFLNFSASLFGQILVNTYNLPPFGDPTTEFEWTESATDLQKNIITVGHTQTSPDEVALLVTKQTGNGIILWEQIFVPSGAIASRSYGIRVIADAANNIFVTGASLANVAEGFNYIILKYNSEGVLQWSQIYNGPDNLNDIPSAIKLNSTGDLFVTGGSYGMSTGLDYATVKLNSTTGTIDWSDRYDHVGLDDAPVDISFDANGDPVILGGSTTSSVTWDYATLKHDKTNGIVLKETRVQSLGGIPEALSAFTKDGNNNFYISGSYTTPSEGDNIQTIKLDADLNVLWSVSYDRYGQDEGVHSIIADANNNLYVTGYSENIAGLKDLMLQKLDSNGNLLWTRFRQPEKEGYHVQGLRSALNSQGDVYIAGEVRTDSGSYIVSIKWDGTGEKIWALDHEAASTERNRPSSILVQDNGDVIISAYKKVSGTTKYYTLKLVEFDRNTQFEFHDSIPKYKKNQLIVKFHPDALIENRVDNLKVLFASPAYFLKPEAFAELSPYIDGKNARLIRIFKRLKTTDLVSINRLGEEIPIPEFWSTFVLTTSNGTDLGNLIQDLKALYPTVIYAHLNYVGQATETDPPNDSYYSNGNPDDGLPQFALDYFPGFPVYENANINMTEGWCIETGKSHIRVGVFDDPLDYKHQDFGYDQINNNSSKIIDGWYFAGAGQNLFTIDNVYTFGDHGTSMAGIIGALTNNRDDPNLSDPARSRIAGVAGGWYTPEPGDDDRGASLYSLGAFELVYNGDVPSSNFIYADLEYMADAIVSSSIDDPNGDYNYGLHVMNHSWGIDRFLNDLPPDNPNAGVFNEETIGVLRDATHFANRSQVVFLASRGNGKPNGSGGAFSGDLLSEEPLYPACYHDDWVINVGGTGRSGGYKDINNGDNFWEPSIGENIDVAAPSATATIITLDVGDTAEGGYKRSRGTSAACAYTSGLASLLLSHANATINNDLRNLAPEDVEFIIERTADYQALPFFVNGTDNGIYNDYTGHGKINAGEALKEIQLPCKTVWHFDSKMTPAYISPPVLIETDRLLYYPEPPLQIPDATIPSPLPGGEYLVDVYEVTAVITHNIPGDEFIEAAWSRSSSSNLYGIYTNQDEIYPYENVTLVNYSDNSATLKGYFYHFTDQDGNDQGWLPFNVSEGNTPRFSYSILSSSCTTSNENFEDLIFNANVYPNPAQSVVHINLTDLDLSHGMKIECFDILGRKIETIYNNEDAYLSEIQIDHNIESLNSGLYIYKFSTEKANFIQSFIKE